ncbi:hypothetical protein IC175_00320 [Clostridioides sp. ES-S-0123-01]|uniref:hypothetical protein n=1 Tax=Clostridioides sp. ES-S-0123-01 TaxID=2770783 RepID=UPI001D1158D4|nr:hypothetical protein [Clostridioides sp. ES-S-0123-01]
MHGFCDISQGLKIFITDTGNALSDDEIMNLSKSINTNELLCYRNEVANGKNIFVQKRNFTEVRL